MGKDEEGGVAGLRRLTKTQIHANLDRQDCEFILRQFLNQMPCQFLSGIAQSRIAVSNAISIISLKEVSRSSAVVSGSSTVR